MCAVSGAVIGELGPEESLALPANVPVCRVGFSQHALPVIRPVDHLVDGDHVVIPTHAGSALVHSTFVSEVVLFEADQFDPRTRTGWSVMVIGRAAPVAVPLKVARYQRLCTSWPGARATRSPPAR